MILSLSLAIIVVVGTTRSLARSLVYSCRMMATCRVAQLHFEIEEVKVAQRARYHADHRKGGGGGGGGCSTERRAVSNLSSLATASSSSSPSSSSSCGIGDAAAALAAHQRERLAHVRRVDECEIDATLDEIGVGIEALQVLADRQGGEVRRHGDKLGGGISDGIDRARTRTANASAKIERYGRKI
jgi:hypothetical protein